MSNLAAKQNHGYVVVNFSNVTDKGLKKLTDALKKAGAPVTDIEASNKKSKRDGLFIKKAKMFFENGQTMTLFIGDQGDIFQLTLNSTKQPIPSVNNNNALAKEMNRLMVRNQAKFDKAQARKSKAVTKNTSTTKPASRSLVKRLNEAKTSLSTAQENYNSVETHYKDISLKVNTAKGTVNQLEDELQTEKAKTAELEQQIKELS